MKKYGFTLIEVLAVIIVLSVIAIITVPIVTNVLDSSEKEALKNTAYGIIDAANLYYTNEQLSGNDFVLKEFIFPEDNELDYKGEKPKNGRLLLVEDGNIAMAISNDKYCVIKRFDKDVAIKKGTEDCTISYFTEPYYTLENEIKESLKDVITYVKYSELKDRISDFSEVEKKFLLEQLKKSRVRLKLGTHLTFSDGSEWINIAGSTPHSASYAGELKSIVTDYSCSNTSCRLFSYDRNYMYLIPASLEKYSAMILQYGTIIDIQMAKSGNMVYSTRTLQENLTNIGLVFDDNSFVRNLYDSEYEILVKHNNGEENNDNDYLQNVITEVYGGSRIKRYIDGVGTILSLPVLANDEVLNPLYLVKIPLSNLNVEAVSIENY